MYFERKICWLIVIPTSGETMDPYPIFPVDSSVALHERENMDDMAEGRKRSSLNTDEASNSGIHSIVLPAKQHNAQLRLSGQPRGASW
ncbi:hypothetical protein WT97_19775 [Burkholderia sp. MSMB1459WGS]|nr:hypothetical protein WT97_19775 [Burkholderia sp. MSMB1459WGS]